MRCHEARLRIARYHRQREKIESDRELLEHLKQCPACAHDLKADENLSRLLNAAGADDTSNVVPLEQQKAHVIAKAGEMTRRSNSPMATVFRPFGIFKRKPALGLGTALAVIILAVIALVPFQFHRTVGYTITMNGVNMELAGDIDRICGMLSNLGLEDALVDIIGCDTICSKTEFHECDTTCSLMIVELKTREEAERVAAAFARFDSEDLKTSIRPVRARTSSTLLDHANETLLQRNSDIN